MVTKKIIHLSLLALIGINGVESAKADTLQDTTEAASYFEKQLNFYTNPYAVNSFKDGKMIIGDKALKVVIVDVRAEKDFRVSHIPGAINLPYDKFNNFTGEEMEFAGLTKDGFNIIYCYTADCNLSKKACIKFASLGYPVKEMTGGFEAWVQHKYRLEQ